MLKESYKNRIQKLAGIINESAVKLKADTGRSDKETLSWYSEDYLLNLGSKILNTLDAEVEKEESLKIKLYKSSTKINANSLFITISVNGFFKEHEIDEEFEIALTVQFSDDSNTVASVTYRGVTNKFNLNSKHSSEDLNKFILETVENILNSLRISNLNPKS